MKCQSLFSEKKKKNKENISKCRALKFLPRVLSITAAKQLPYLPQIFGHFLPFVQKVSEIKAHDESCILKQTNQNWM